MSELPWPTQPLTEWMQGGRRMSPAVLSATRYRVFWARHQDDVQAAQRLRFEVFANELGAQLSGSVPGRDVDALDAHCEHLIVRDRQGGEVVGTYRVLLPQVARRLGGLYADTEFDLGPLDSLRPHMMELGRSCVHRHHRSGAVILALWSSLHAFALRHDIRSVIGCSSVAVQDGDALVWQLHGALMQAYATDEALRVLPRRPFALPGEPATPQASQRALRLAPPLLRAYLHFGARICGAPAWDPAFRVADYLTLLRMEDINPRFSEFVMRRQVALA